MLSVQILEVILFDSDESKTLHALSYWVVFLFSIGNIVLCIKKYYIWRRDYRALLYVIQDIAQVVCVYKAENPAFLENICVSVFCFSGN